MSEELMSFLFFLPLPLTSKHRATLVGEGSVGVDADVGPVTEDSDTLAARLR